VVVPDAVSGSTPQLVIRPAAGPADAAVIQEIYAPWVTDTAISFEETPPSTQEILARMEARPRLPWLIAEVDGEPTGYAYASRHAARWAYRLSADVSVYLRGDQRGRGVGRSLYEALIPQVQALGYVSLFACIALPNPASVALHTAVGFQPAGVHPNAGHKFDRWHAVGWYVLTPDTAPVNPDEPREWALPAEG
jgi:phosphinothricin acetyltransferase